MKRNLIYILFLIALMAFAACNKDQELLKLENYSNPNVGNSSTYPLNGEYWVHMDTAHIAGTDTTWSIDPFGFLHQKIELYNTAANNGDSLWLENDSVFNQFNLIGLAFKSKIACNPSKLSFGSLNAPNIVAYYSTVNVMDGWLKLKAAKSLTGVTVDSISFYYMYNAMAPGLLIRISGIRRTGFPKDDAYTF